MRGVFVTKAKIVSEDERRKIIEIQNGQINVRNMKILIVKKGEALLGNHWHYGYEVMYIFKGAARYKMKNMDTLEEQEFDLKEGDVVFRTGRITHAGIFTEDSIVIDGGSDTYISQEFNDIPEVILT